MLLGVLLVPSEIQKRLQSPLIQQNEAVFIKLGDNQAIQILFVKYMQLSSKYIYVYASLLLFSVRNQSYQ